MGYPEVPRRLTHRPITRWGEGSATFKSVTYERVTRQVHSTRLYASSLTTWTAIQEGCREETATQFGSTPELGSALV